MTLSKMKPVIFAAAIVMMAAPQMSFAQSADALSNLYACEALTTKDAQLSCFLTETARLRGVDARGDAVKGTAAVTEKDTRVARIDQARKDQELKAAKQELAALKQAEEVRKNPPKKRSVAIVSAVRYGANGYMRFTLENGEVWQQIETGKVRLGRAEPDMLTIKRASLGSFLGRINDKRPSFRIRQVK